MDISIIIPIYNVEKFIDRCLVSLFNQTKKKGVEYIIVNDASTDSSMHIVNSLIEKYGIKAKIIDKRVNEGLVLARLSGIKVSTGKYVLHLDSDDWFESNMLEEMYISASSINADIVVCDYYINHPGSQKYQKGELNKNSIECIKIFARDHSRGAVWNKLFKRELYNFFDLNISQHINMWEDFFICTHLFYYAEKIIYLPKAYLHYMRDNQGCITNYINDKKLIDMQVVINKISSFISGKEDSERVEEYLSCRKLELKYMLLNKYPYEQHKYKYLFPESAKYLWTCKGIHINKKCALFFAQKGLICPFNFIVKLRSLIIKYVKSA